MAKSSKKKTKDEAKAVVRMLPGTKLIALQDIDPWDDDEDIEDFTEREGEIEPINEGDVIDLVDDFGDGTVRIRFPDSDFCLNLKMDDHFKLAPNPIYGIAAASLCKDSYDNSNLYAVLPVDSASYDELCRLNGLWTKTKQNPATVDIAAFSVPTAPLKVFEDIYFSLEDMLESCPEDFNYSDGWSDPSEVYDDGSLETDISGDFPQARAILTSAGVQFVLFDKESCPEQALDDYAVLHLPVLTWDFIDKVFADI